MREKRPTIQIRPSVTVDIAVILEILAKKEETYIGKILEKLLEESETFKNAKNRLYDL